MYLLGPEDHLFQPCGPQDMHTGPSRPGLPQAALIWAATKQESIYGAPTVCQSRGSHLYAHDLPSHLQVTRWMLLSAFYT